MVDFDDACHNCEVYDEDCKFCRASKSNHAHVSRSRMEEDSTKRQKRLKRHQESFVMGDLHPEDAGDETARVKRVGTASEGGIYVQGVPEGNDETGAVEFRPSFGGTMFGTDYRQMKNPAAEIFRRGNPMKIAWRLLKNEYACPKCSGAGSFDDDGDEITCFDCKGTGSIEPTHHPGADNKGAVSMTAVDIREPTHVEQYDVENAMPLEGSMPKITTTGQVIDPKRQAFSRDGNMKQTRQVIAPQGTVDNTHPDLRHRLPSVYMRERDGKPSNAGLNITGDPSRGGTPLFQRGDSMTVAWRLLKNG